MTNINVQKLAIGIITLIIATLIVVSVAIPVLSDAEKIAGTPITIKNGDSIVFDIGEYKGDTTIDISTANSKILFTINGEEYPFAAAASTSVLISDGIGATTNSAGTLVTLAFKDGNTQSVSSTNTAQLIFSDGQVTVSYNGSEIYTGEYSYLYTLKAGGEYRYKSSNASVHSINDILHEGNITVDGTKVYYAIRNGEVTGTEGYTFELTYNLTPYAGTTDVFTLSSATVKASDGTTDATSDLGRITTFREIVGHESGSANSALISIVPLLILVGLVIGAVGMFINNRD